MPTPVNISASRGAAVLGLSKWSTPVQVFMQIKGREWCEANGYVFPEVEYSPAMRWGHAFESAIIELAGNNISNRELLFEKKYITCHVDGMYPDGITLHEGKTTNSQYFRENFGKPGTDAVPSEYQIQCQHQMICTGADKVILSVLVFPKRVEEWEEMEWEVRENGDNSYYLYKESNGRLLYPSEWAEPLDQMGYFHQYEINAHEELQKLMIEAYTEFWNKNIIPGIPPEPRDYPDIKALVKEPVGTIILPPELENLKAEYDQIGKEISSTGTLARRREEIKVKLLNHARTSGHVIDDDSKEKWIFRNERGKKIASYGKTEKGWMFR